MDDPGTLMISCVLYIIVGTIWGFVAKTISEGKGRSPNEGFWFGFFLGVIGIIVVIVLPAKEVTFSQSKLVDAEFKKCPYCGEDIKFDAIFCKYCGRELTKAKSLVANNQSIKYEIKDSDKISIPTLIPVLMVGAGFIIFLISIGLIVTQ